jgi:hypothetical protein
MVKNVFLLLLMMFNAWITVILVLIILLVINVLLDILMMIFTVAIYNLFV